ncbi:ribonuclease E/G [Gluconacetobacter entanii]|uniref:Ribonuclease E n=1 Tax=Gluconacetobacter entanii TaxID=108528 RepID=A0ABT3K8P5_9PROT|nr:ribonuclease E/G [Gluconacetobacter entanii]MCW4591758.1 ribonuclease E/G [Gluconacetobacter entanii]MCW4595120.1 ribonuclease E/G [Gluconacetobacter entanii]NPC88009.1 ribonuclease E/G [Gluconacetobacter entanii]
MTKRMLIDTTHAEETRVVVMDGNRLEDYDVEAAAKKQLKGNIYLAKVIRVEPSLQAAFVDYGGNRHGFLAFSEIHPDYYQIPVADREKLLALQEEERCAEEARNAREDDEKAEGDEDATEETAARDGEAEEAEPETVGGENDTGDEPEAQRRIARFLRNYKIQEVIRRRQILLVQVVKEERGNKGAALTTYVSLAGRYCVLMPNSLRGGGVSRKITSVADRRRLREIIAELQIPHGMAMIVRTAGAQRPRAEIMRDCEYLLRLWDDIREHTLKSVAPALIYEEASLIKRAIRDIYTREVGEILIDGEAGWKSAREFMRMLMPQNAQKVRLWQDHGQTLFSHYRVEGLLDSMLSPSVQLRSGGYLVINQTEALVAIDVNSGRATKERNIEETALRTNLEAADEVARQLRLRDLAGLIVIDFIDMESRKHNGMVERRLKEALRNDRARIQVGHISHFGLLEMSRQRLRPSIAESTFTPCPHCEGTGIIRGVESSALHVLRAIEDEGMQRRAAAVTVHVAPEIALYILNNKRAWLHEIEERHKMHVTFAADSTLHAAESRIERTRPQTAQFEASAPAITAEPEAPHTETAGVREIPIHSEPPATTAEGGTAAPDATPLTDEDAASGTDHRRRRRRRRRRSSANREVETQGTETVEAEVVAVPEPVVEVGYKGPTPADPFGDAIIDIFDVIEQTTTPAATPVIEPEGPVVVVEEEAPEAPAAEEEKPRRAPRRRTRRTNRPITTTETVVTAEPATPEAEAPVETPVEAPVEVETVEVETPEPVAEVQPEVAVEAEAEAKEKPRRRRTTTRKATTTTTRSRAKKAEAEEPAETVAPAADTAAEEKAEETVTEAKPRRRRATTTRTTATAAKTPTRRRTSTAKAAKEASDTAADAAPEAAAPVAAEKAEEKPKARRVTRRKKVEAEPAAPPAPEAEPAAEEKAPARKATRTRRKKVETTAVSEATPAEPATAEAAPAPKRRTGWWKR